MRRPIRKPLVLAMLLALGGLSAQAQTAPSAQYGTPAARPVPPVTQPSIDAMRAAAQKAIVGNPDVSDKLNLLRASIDAIDEARAGYYPQVALEVGGGREHDDIGDRVPTSQTFDRGGAAVSLTQLLWDGGEVRHQLEHLGHDKLARYFDLLDTTEQTALEATRAYEDVQRYRRLVELAEDNYVQHRYTLSQIQERFKAGVGRGVDNEQVVARLALAESNLTTEVANLHDVMVRYERVVGEAPPAVLPEPPSMSAAIPAHADEAMAAALAGNAAIDAAIENLRSARDVTEERRSSLMPRVEARVRSGAGHNMDGVIDEHNDTTAQVVLDWTVFDGGASQARIRQQVRAADQAADLRDKACRDVRQSASIAYNDTKKLVEELAQLDRNVISIEKARDAYRQQFDIGQRSLLDLLNSENELYTARRAYANAQYDLEIARLRTLASMQQLTTKLGLARLDVGPALDDAVHWDAGADGPARCPVLVTEVQPTPLEDLNRRAQQMMDAQRAAHPVSATAPAPAAQAPAKPAH